MSQFLSRLEMVSELAGNRHLMFASAILDASGAAMAGPAAFTAEGSRRLKSSMVDMGWSYVEQERAIMADVIDETAKDAHRSAIEQLGYSDPEKSFDALSERFSQSHAATEEYLYGEVVSQTNRDVNQVLRDYQNASLRVLMTADSKGISRTQAGMQVIMEEISIRRRLWFRDRAGRKIPSQKHIRRTWRMVLRDHWLTVYAQSMAMHGITEAVIWHPDPNHHAFGLKVDLTDVDLGLANRDEIFHPNARTLLALTVTEAA
ncbi:MAG: hypothetical protein LPK02_07670 [Rhodobacterales bacterium]|nr:hypothetical protein [Rhodobacterales bacterium]